MLAPGAHEDISPETKAAEAHLLLRTTDCEVDGRECCPTAAHMDTGIVRTGPSRETDISVLPESHL